MPRKHHPLQCPKVLHWSNGRCWVIWVTSDPDEVTEEGAGWAGWVPRKASQPAPLERGGLGGVCGTGPKAAQVSSPPPASG